MKNIRYGFRLMWQEVPADMRKYKVGAVGSFDPKNSHGGVCWGWPKECSLTNNQAKTILFNIYKKRSLTFPQMTVVRKALAYAYELSGGALPKGNYPGVKEVWDIVRPSELPESTTTTLPQRIPTPAELKRAFTKEWSPAHAWCLMRWLQGLIQASDLFIFGLRSREDIDRVKKSTKHQKNWRSGWQCTSFVGGRAKLCGVKKNTRPWKVWRRCHCPGKCHVRPPQDFHEVIGKDGNPTVAVKWCTCCPLAALELIWQLQQPNELRCYGKWLPSGRYGSSNTGNVAEMAIDWMVAQDVCDPDSRFDTNSGRKSLARWTSHLHVPYEESVHIHGDLWDVWHDAYELAVNKSKYKFRNQSLDPKIATRALLRFVNFLGRGKKLKVNLSMTDRYLHHVLVGQGKPELANRIRDGMPSDDEDSED